MTKLNQGDLVTVRDFSEISRTLDKFGALDGLPFNPEMLKYCGQTFLVRRRVNKLIQEGVGASMRRIRDVVLLDGTTCDGKAHDDCQRACFPLWKTAWLKPPDDKIEGDQNQAQNVTEVFARDITLKLMTSKTCQVTELMKATSPLPLWHPLRHYWDITSHTYSPKEYLSYILGRLYRKTLKKILGMVIKKKPAQKPLVSVAGLDLQPGELVEVKSADEIRATLDDLGKTRGLFFMPGMWEYCGQRLRVLFRIDRMMSEKTGDIRNLKQTVILDGVTCDGKAHSGCQRGCYVFWKDTWLRRIEEGEPDQRSLNLP